MSHVDDGLIHAYLDGAFPADGREGAEIEAHLEVCVDCRVLLEKAREVKERAHVVMNRLAPPALAVPPFEEIRARRERNRAGAGGPAMDPAQPASARPTARRLLPSMPLAWAASLVLAIGAGWMVRAYLGPAQLGLADEHAAVGSDAAADRSKRSNAADSPTSGRQDDGRRLSLPPMTAPVTPAAGAAANAAAASDERRSEVYAREAEAQAAGRAAETSSALEPQRAVPPPTADVANLRAPPPPPPTSPTAEAFSTKAAMGAGAQVVDVAAGTTPEAQLLRAYARATADGAWQTDPIVALLTPLGYEPVARLEGERAVRTERATVDALEVLRSVYVVDGDSVEVIQRMKPAALALEEMVVTGASAADTTAANRARRPPPPTGVIDTAALRLRTAGDVVAFESASEMPRRIAEIRVAAPSPAFGGASLLLVAEGDRLAILKGAGAASDLAGVAARVRR